MMATFPGAPDWVCQARRFLTAWLGPDHPAVDTSTLLLSETFTNGILHGQKQGAAAPQIHISAELGLHRLMLEVTDEGGSSDPVLGSDATEEAENGRGLTLLGLVAEKWGWDRLPDHRVRVWFTIGF
jgi:anti-sigma regulatory factor (Ser/Thr protein kinase)